MKALVVYYSLYGNTFKLAKAVAEGARSVDGADVQLMRVPEITPVEVIEKNDRMRNAQICQKAVPVVRVEALFGYDALLFGSPAWHGTMAGPMKHFFDKTGMLWEKGALEGKMAGVFTCCLAGHGGQEQALLSMMITLLHLGMIVAGLPRSLAAVTGRTVASPYGVSAVLGPDPRQPINPADLESAKALGRRVTRLAGGRARAGEA